MDNKEKNKTEKSTLYLVATPIGNLADISERAKKVLSEVDFIAAEDTRNSMKLLGCYGIHKEMVSYHEHNKRESGERIVSRLLAGESCAVITDAGMPAISDPGEDIVRLCVESGITVTAVPGCSAAITALALSALSTARFAFEGFLPAKASERAKRLEPLKNEDRTMIFYEAPHKLKGTLNAMMEIFGPERKVSLARELTKLNEDIMHGTFASASAYYEEHEPRGEYVIVVEGAKEKVSGDDELSELSPEELVKMYEDTGLSRMDAIKKAAKARGMSKSEMYKLLL